MGLRFVAGVAFALIATSAFAHHTAAYLYDVQNRVELTGTVTAVEWKNPHVIVHVDAKGQDGAVKNVALEGRAVYIMRR